MRTHSASTAKGVLPLQELFAERYVPAFDARREAGLCMVEAFETCHFRMTLKADLSKTPQTNEEAREACRCPIQRASG